MQSAFALPQLFKVIGEPLAPAIAGQVSQNYSSNKPLQNVKEQSHTPSPAEFINEVDTRDRISREFINKEGQSGEPSSDELVSGDTMKSRTKMKISQREKLMRLPGYLLYFFINSLVFTQWYCYIYDPTGTVNPGWKRDFS